ARVVKVEDPNGGDAMRTAPPLVDGVGAGFLAFFRGVESAALDLRTPRGAAAVRALAGRADVLVESFRPGTLERWGLSPASLAAGPAAGGLFSGPREYRRYRCADGAELAIAALEPKLWRGLVELLGLPADSGADALAARFAERESSAWLEGARARGLPVSRVNDARAALQEADLAPLLGRVPGAPLVAPERWLVGFAPRTLTPAPALGAHTEALLAELG